MIIGPAEVLRRSARRLADLLSAPHSPFPGSRMGTYIREYTQQVLAADRSVVRLLAPERYQRWQALADIGDSGMPVPPLFRSPALDTMSGSKLHVVLENLIGPTHSIKDRAARVVLARMSRLPRGSHLVLASSGNHALAYTEAAQARGFTLTSVLPIGTPPYKVAKLEALGARVVLHGDDWTASAGHARTVAEREDGWLLDLTEADSVAALGTSGYDAIAQLPYADTVVLHGVGGAWAAATARSVRDLGEMWGREYTILVACPEKAATIFDSFLAGHPVVHPATAAVGGGNVDVVDAHLLPMLRASIDDVVKVPDSWILDGVPLLSREIGHPVENVATLGAMSVIGHGGVLPGATGATYDLRGRHVLTFVTGGNIEVI